MVSTTGEVCIEARDLVVGYDKRILCRIERLTVAMGEVIGFSGPNGSGKTSILKALAGMDARLAGTCEITLEGTSLSARRARHSGALYYLPQRTNLFLSMSVRQNVQSITRHGISQALVRAENAWRQGADFISMNVDRRSEELSGGERQIVALTSYLASPAKLLFLDEPTEGLSSNLSNEVFATLRDNARANDRIIICVDHDHGLLKESCDRTFELRDNALS